MTRDEHLLVKLLEEAAEVQQRVTKALNFGIDEVQPEQEMTNEQRIVEELNDFIAVVEMLQEAHVLKTALSKAAQTAKKRKVEHYLEYSRSLGRLSE
jgi:hypothetical protein